MKLKTCFGSSSDFSLFISQPSSRQRWVWWDLALTNQSSRNWWILIPFCKASVWPLWPLLWTPWELWTGQRVVLWTVRADPGRENVLDWLWIGMWQYASLKSMEVNHSPAGRKVLVSPFWTILCLGRCSRCSTGCWVGDLEIGCKTLEISELLPVPLHFCSEADAMPPTNRGSCGIYRTEKGECSLTSVLLPLWGWPLGLPTSPKTGAILPLQVDLEQQLGHLIYRTQVTYTGNIFHIFYFCIILTIYTFLLRIPFDKMNRADNTKVYM